MVLEYTKRGFILKIQAVIFDMDGTIFDSEPVYMKINQDAAKQLGGFISDELYHSTVGTTMGESYSILAKGLADDFPMDKFADLWPILWDEYVKENGVVLKTGMLELIQYLNANKITKALATSSYRHEAELCLKLSNLRAEFATIVTGDEVKNGKPDPEIYLKAASNINIDPKNCLAIEDSNAGAQAAINAGMQTIVIPDLIPVSDEVKKHAVAVFESLHDVIDFLKT